jgi:uncharacterized protein (TIGR03089 family)
VKARRVQLGGTPGSRPTPTDLPAAVRDAASDLGHRPAITVLRPDRRDEQGMASLAQWAAKGAHLLEADLLLEPGDRLALRGPASWPLAAVALAAWWAGIVVTLDGDAEVAVVHEGHDAPSGAEDVLFIGDAVDGSPTGPVDGEPWAQAVQAFPDHPPTPRGHAGSPALEHEGLVATQQELIARVAQDQGVLGIDAATVEAVDGLIAVAVRPVVTGRATVVLTGADREDAAGERVAVWR